VVNVVDRSRRFAILLVVSAAVVAMSIGIALAALPPGGTFTDDNGNVHEGSIEAIAAEGITKGCNPPTNDQYCPSSFLNRGQMAAFIRRALSLPPSTSDYFTDDDGTTFEGDINSIAEAGITKGCNPPDNDRFCPDGNVRRDVMAAFLRRAFDYPPSATDFFDDDNGSLFEADINAIAKAGVTKGCNPPTNDEYCPHDLVKRDQMASFFARALGLKPIVPPPIVTTPSLAIEEVASGLTSPMLATAPVGDDRLFIAERGGAIKILDEGAIRSEAFLTVAGISTCGEGGLLGLAFHPQFASNGRFFVHYTSSEGPLGFRSNVVEYHATPSSYVADSVAVRTVLTLDQPTCFHNAGSISFGPDGNLYIPFGDGGTASTAQDPHTWLGAVVRISVEGPAPYSIPSGNPYDGSDGAVEVWANGLRNPFRSSVDSLTGDIYIGDVGQKTWEEVSVGKSGVAEINYGWNTAEGLPTLKGTYFYADFFSEWVRSFRFTGDAVGEHRDWTSDFGPVTMISGFGQDGYGELYIVTISGTVYKIVPGP
jgi:hypothetical protein